MKNLTNLKNNQGIALIITILLMSLILFLALYFLNFSLTEKRIAHSQTWGAKTYYLAEAGIAEIVWQLKNNETYKNNFETDPNWIQTFTRDNPFGANSGSYTVTITNSALAHGVISTVGAIDIGNGKTSQRIVKTDVYRAMGQGGVELADNCGYADGDIDISSSIVNFYNGSAHSNNVFTINGLSTVNIDTDLNAVNNFNKSWLSTVNIVGDTYAANYPPAAAEIEMPAIDFDSDDPNSFKNKADAIYSENDFRNLMQNNQNLTLNDPITYVEGDVEMRGGQYITVNGLLVVERDLVVGHRLCWGWSRCGHSSLTINHTEGQPSGILAKRKIEFKLWTGNINMDGVAYANDQLNISGSPVGFSFNANGGLVSRKLTITSAWQTINITRNEEIINSTLSATEFSPIIIVEHWEEEY
ncbi:MAG: hypothetical protein U9R14_03580 [Patescibacteria group bacterium]|nr:hypothetical protein [Patescibacteria group bacterium]